MKFSCPVCQKALEIADKYAERETQCPACGRYIKVPPNPVIKQLSLEETDVKAMRAGSSARDAHLPQRVTIVGVNIPFLSMVALIIKWSLASIPAAIIFCGLYWLLMWAFIGRLILDMGIK